MKEIRSVKIIAFIIASLMIMSCYSSDTSDTSLSEQEYAKKEIIYISEAYTKTETFIGKIDSGEHFTDLSESAKAEVRQDFVDISLIYNNAVEANEVTTSTLNTAYSTLGGIETEYPSYSAELTLIGEIKELHSNAISVLDPSDPFDGVIQLLEVNLPYTEAFSDENFQTRGWFNLAETGDRTWEGSSQYSNVSISAYQSSDDENEAWLISPVIDLSVNAGLTFECAVAYYTHAGLGVYISTGFDGTVAGTTWTQLTITLPDNDSTNNTYYELTCDLSAYTGETAVIAFRYNGDSGESETGTFRIRNFSIAEP